MLMETALIAAMRAHTARRNANLVVVVRLNNGKFFTSTIHGYYNSAFYFLISFDILMFQVPCSSVLVDAIEKFDSRF